MFEGPVGDGGTAGQIIGNTITGNRRTGMWLNSGGFTVNGNVTTDNGTYGLLVSDRDTDVATDATCNWWGAANGPSGWGNLARGDGDRIGHWPVPLEWTPWSLTEAAEGPCTDGLDHEPPEPCVVEWWGYRNA